MRLSFRQGIVAAPNGFLTLNNSTVNLTIPASDLALITFADGDSNYLLSERFTVTSAWSGPFTAGSQSYWLYWDIDVTTGQRTFGHTLLSPVDGATPPTDPRNDQHWFDTVANKMKVWNSAAGRWVPRIRVFAAKLISGSILTSMSINSPAYVGTQIGSLQNQPNASGALVFDINGSPLRRSNGTFFTTEDVAVAGIASSSQVKLGGICINAVATENIPAYSVVNFTDFNKISLARNIEVTPGVYGLIEVDATTGSVVNVVTEGVVTNLQWDWTSAGVNAPLYVGSTGELTATPPPSPIMAGTVIDKHTVLLRASIANVTVDASGSVLIIKNEGATIANNVTSLNFTGQTINATSQGHGAVTVDVTGSGGGGGGGSSPPTYDYFSIASDGQTVIDTVVPTTAKTSNTVYHQVFRNGVMQWEGIFYTVTGPNQITFTSNTLLAGDDVIVLAYSS